MGKDNEGNDIQVYVEHEHTKELLILNLPFKNKTYEWKPKKVSTSFGFSLFKIEKQRKRFNRQIKKRFVRLEPLEEKSHISLEERKLSTMNKKNFNGLLSVMTIPLLAACQGGETPSAASKNSQTGDYSK